MDANLNTSDNLQVCSASHLGEANSTHDSSPTYELHLERLPRTVELKRDNCGASKNAGEELFYFVMVDQTKLPASLEFIETTSWLEVINAIKTLAVRGAPALGVTGAAALALWLQEYAQTAPASTRIMSGNTTPQNGIESFLDELTNAAHTIANARPTAVNLAWGTNKLHAYLVEEIQANLLFPANVSFCTGAPKNESLNTGSSANLPLTTLCAKAFEFVKTMEAEDEAANRALGAYGAELLPANARVLTHCNAGSLATVYYGTALGVIYAAATQGKIQHVWADETRPVGQGSRLTAWELSRAGIPVTLECDNMAASLMAAGCIDAVIVGADRITANGDTANKIGTYGLAVLAQYHDIPFYVAAPTSTIDATLPNGFAIPIEQRAATEVLPHSIPGVEVWNPAFDVTPANLITAWITETGVIHF